MPIHVFARIFTHTYVHMHACMHTHARTHTHTHTYTHTNTHTYTHKHTHKHTQYNANTYTHNTRKYNTYTYNLCMYVCMHAFVRSINYIGYILQLNAYTYAIGILTPVYLYMQISSNHYYVQYMVNIRPTVSLKMHSYILRWMY